MRGKLVCGRFLEIPGPPGGDGDWHFPPNPGLSHHCHWLVLFHGRSMTCQRCPPTRPEGTGGMTDLFTRELCVCANQIISDFRWIRLIFLTASYDPTAIIIRCDLSSPHFSISKSPTTKISLFLTSDQTPLKPEAGPASLFPVSSNFPSSDPPLSTSFQFIFHRRVLSSSGWKVTDFWFFWTPKWAPKRP